MGKDKTTQQGASQSTTKVEQTPEQKAFIQSLLGIQQAGEGDQITTNKNTSALINQLLTGGELPGFLQDLVGGLSPEAISAQASQTALASNTGFQNLGIIDSGSAFQGTAKNVAQSVLLPAEQFNLGLKGSLLGAGLTGSFGQQAGFQGNAGILGSSLSGLNTINQSGSFSGSTKAMNPFLKSFQQSAGQGFGQTVGSFGSGSFQGGANGDPSNFAKFFTGGG